VSARIKEGSVLVEADGAIRIVTLNRPEKLNAANLDLHQSLAAVWPRIAADPEARAVVLTGAGRAFSAGGDMEFVTGWPLAPDLTDALHEATLAQMTGMLSAPQPIVAAVNGPAIGFGASTVALCDVVVMADGAYLCEPHGRLGLATSPGIVLAWPRLTSLNVAKELALLGRRIGAQEALSLGLANRVVPSGAVRSTAMALAHELADLDPAGVALAKAAFNAPLLATLGTSTGATVT
jgi:enoyl-CoA hydratase